MPDAAAHSSAYANHLASYADTVDKHPDWGAVMLFHCAVHYVEKLLASGPTPLHCTDHAARDFELKSRYASIWPHYRVLKSESLKARYMDGGVFTMTARQVRARLHDQRLSRIVLDVDARLAARGPQIG